MTGKGGRGDSLLISLPRVLKCKIVGRFISNISEKGQRGLRSPEACDEVSCWGENLYVPIRMKG